MRIVRAGRLLVLIALLTAVIAVAGQTALLEGRAGAALDGAAIARMLLQTQAGTSGWCGAVCCSCSARFSPCG